MRISDWSSDVCSSDLLAPLAAEGVVPQTELLSAQREVVDIQGRLAAARQAISRSQAAVREAGAEVQRARFDFQQEALNERSQLRRSEERRVGKEWVSTFRSRWSRGH